MHELWISRSILEIVNEHAIKQGCTCIKIIYLEVGVLMAIEKSALMLSFDVMKKGTIAENAILKFIDVPGQAWCERCQNTIKINQYYQSCELCGSLALTIIAGEQLRIQSMEIE